MRKIPVFILTGFLGSGKTTVLKNMLKDMKEHGNKPALILNELGSENVEKELFEDESMIEMLNGCICCTIQEDMKVELTQLIQTQRDINVLLIEGTGIANPGEIIEALTHPDLIEQVEVQSVIGLVDGSKYLEYQSMFQSSKEIRVMLKQQITTSTLIIINKQDLIDDKKMKKVVAKIEELKIKDVPIIKTSYGEVDTETLITKRFLTNTIDIKKKVHKHHHHHHHHHHHSHPFQALKISGFEAISRRKLEKWLTSQSHTLLRAKGYVRFADTNTLFSFQYASGQLQTTAIDTNQEPCLILIGTGLDQKEVVSSFDQLC